MNSTLQGDRTYSFETTTPPVSYFLKAAAGIEKGAQKPGKELDCIFLSVIPKGTKNFFGGGGGGGCVKGRVTCM